MYQPHVFTLTADGYRGPAPSWPAGAPSVWLVDTEQVAGTVRSLAPRILDVSELARVEKLAFGPTATATPPPTWPCGCCSASARASPRTPYG